jgi:hypothetical protein
VGNQLNSSSDLTTGKVATASGTADSNESEVLCTVIAVIPELMQARVMTTNGFRYALTRKTPGINVTELVEGQQVACTVSIRLPRVLSARVVS